MDVKAYAKINLTLDVLGKRPDGYHELETIMCAVSLADDVSVSFDCEGISLDSEPPLPRMSTAYRAASAYAEAAKELHGRDCPAHILIRRNIPEMAGLGGSSADAAAVLSAMEAHYGALDEAKLYSLALTLGSDVPFLLSGGAALCRGRGEVMTPVILPKLAVLIVMGAGRVSTRELFTGLEPPYAKRTTALALAALEAGDMGRFYSAIGNALTSRAETLASEIRGNIARMREAGALASAMTGSGSAVFGLFSTEAEARRAENAFTKAAFSKAAFSKAASSKAASSKAAFTAVVNML